MCTTMVPIFVAVAKVFGSVLTDMGVRKAVLSIDEVGPLTPDPDMAFEKKPLRIL